MLVVVYGLASIVSATERKMMGVEKTPWERTDDDAQLTLAVTCVSPNSFLTTTGLIPVQSGRVTRNSPAILNPACRAQRSQEPSFMLTSRDRYVACDTYFCARTLEFIAYLIFLLQDSKFARDSN